jgi:acyl carrier protein
VTTDAPSAIREALAGIAPEADLDGLPPEIDLQEELDLDSMDFLNFLVAVHKSLHVDIPEADYAKVQTIGGIVGYLQSRLENR